MDRTTQDIKRGLELLAGRFGPSPIQPATVESVDDGDTITVRLGTDLVLDEVRLKSVVKDGGKIVLVPKVGSIVLIAAIENSVEFVCVAVEEISEMCCKIGLTELKQDETGLLIKKGNDTVGTIVDDLIKEILKISAPMNKPAIKLIQQRAQQILK